MKSLFVLVSTVLTLSGCVEMQRSETSGYAHREPELYQSRDRHTSERESTMSDMGYAPKRDLSEHESDALNSRLALQKAEKALEGKREREQYFKNKPYMRSDRERLEFLAQDSFESRQRWLNAKGIAASAAHAPDIQALVDINDIALGMTKQAVKDSWGEPELVEVSGNPIYGNERWHYSEQTQSAEGFKSQHRMVYFDSGRVIGWESR
jgi:hypothetical protein